MKKKHSFLYHVLVFVFAQIAWLLLLGIWIYWYVSNYILFEKAGSQLSSPISYEGINIFAFVGGLILLVGISVGMSFTFRHLSVQFKLRNLYDNFIANVTHELKSPLASIQLYLETIKSRNVPAEKRMEFLDMMMKDATRLKNLIDSILEISTLERRKISHQYEIFHVGEILTDIITELIEQFNLPLSSVSFRIESQSEIVAEKNGLKTIFSNLIDNTIKYSRKVPEIRINVRNTSRKVIIEFSDNGIGIPMEEQKKIFNKFYRIYNETIPSVKGTGLGLYLVKEIIKLHGGNISVFSEGSDKGSTFVIELPLRQVFVKGKFNGLLSLKNGKKNSP